MAGFFLIIIGVIFLLKNLGLISAGAWDILWPILLIALGISFVTRQGKAGFFLEECFGWKRKRANEE